MARAEPISGETKKRGAAVFLDRDGTLIEERNYLNRVEQIRLLPGAAAAVRRIGQAGLRPVVVTNQSAVARGWLSLEGLQAIHRELARRFRLENAVLEHFYSCPHHPDFDNGPDSPPCDCRKPLPGLLLKAAADLAICLESSFLVGDRLRDVEAGRRAGCRTALVLTGQGATEARRLADPGRASAEATPDFVARDLGQAVDWILERRRG